MLGPVDCGVVVEILDRGRVRDERGDAWACGALTEAGCGQELVG
jgi:hypothetical protein